MAGPCVNDTPTIVLSVVGDPIGELEATFANDAGSGSETQGDDTTHVVTDNDTPHIQTQTNVIDNSAGLAPMSGIIVVAINPIWCGDSDGPISLIWEASLTVAGHPSNGDQRDTITTQMDTGEIRTFSPGSLVGNFEVAAGSTQSYTWEVRITNDGASAQWSFRFGGSRVVYMRNFG